MAYHESRISEKRRTYEGEESAESLVNWLNHTQNVDGKLRIMRVVRLYFELADHHLGMKRPKYTKIGYEEWREHQTPETKKRDELQKALDEALSFYQTTPSVHIGRTFGRRGEHKGFSVQIGSRPVEGSALAESLERNSKFRTLAEITKNPTELDFIPGAKMGETGAIRYVLELIRSGHISKIRSCRCDRLFFQRFAHQRFCSDKCRLAEFRTSDEARLKRNSYARKLYHLQKTKNVK